jgi:hypothetical protein
MATDLVSRILAISPARVLELVQDGTLRARTVNGETLIDSVAVDRYSDKLDVRIARPEPETFTKIRGRAYREVTTSRGIVLQRV